MPPIATPRRQPLLHLLKEAATGWAALTLVLSLLLSMWFSHYLQNVRGNETYDVFKDRVQHILRSAAQDSGRRSQTLQTLGVLLTQQPNMTQAHFTQLVSSLDLQRQMPGIHNLLYVSAASPPYTIQLAEPERALSGTPLPRAHQLHTLLQQSAQSASDVVSEPLQLAQAHWPNTSLVLTHPVYAPSPTASGTAALQGWILMVMEPKQAFKNIANGLSDNLDMEVFFGPPASGILVYDHDNHHTGHAISFSPNLFKSRLFVHKEVVPTSGQDWTVVISTLPSFQPTSSLGTVALFSRIAGLLLSVFISGIVWRWLHERSRNRLHTQALSSQVEVMALAVSSTRNGVLITDAEQRITWANEGFTRLTGYTLEEALGKHPAQLLGSPNAERHTVDHIRQSVENRHNVEVDILNRKKNGQDHWIKLEIRPYHDHQGQHQGFVEIETDIDEDRSNARILLAALNENDALMRALNELAIVSETDIQGNITRANEMFLHISGYSRADLLGKNHRILNSGHHDASFWRDLWHTISSGTPWRGEVRNRNRQGHYYWVDTMIIPVSSVDGMVEKYVSLRFDITQRKLAEEALLNNRELFSRMGDIAGVGYWLNDLTNKQVELSDQVLKIFEADPDHPPLSEEIFTRYAPESEFVLSMAIREATELGAPFDLELNFLSFKNKMKWVRVAASPEFRDGKVWRLVGAVQDITERVETQRRIAESDRILRSSIDAIGEAFVLYGPDDRLVFCNEQYRNLYAESADLIVPGVKFEDIARIGAERGQYQEAVGRIDEWVAERMANYRLPSSTTVQHLPNGRWVRVAEACTQDGYHVGFRIDITEMKEAVQQAEDASRSKSQFLANMSHEIRTPMNAILGMLQLLQTTNLSASQSDYVSKTQGAAKSLLGILNDILDFSKVEAGKMQLDPEPTVFNDMMGELGIILSSNLGQKRLELLFDIDPQLPRVLVFDSLRLKQILINLAGNAIKFTAQGEVLLRVRQTHREGHTVRLRFEIKDSGIGISPENQKRIFEGFSQAEASTSRRFGGTGLGLAISRRLVEVMGGELTLHSVLGEGSTFSFEIPMPVAIQGGQEASQPAANLERYVLLVDDNPMARTIHTHQLRSLGCLVDDAADPQSAKDQALVRLNKGQNYHTVFMDLELPDTDGWTVANALRQMWESHPSHPTLPRLVILTSHGQESMGQRSATEMAWLNAYLVKPVTPDALQEAMVPPTLARSPNTATFSPATQHELAHLHILLVEDNPINQQVASELLQSRGAHVQVADNGQIALDLLNNKKNHYDMVLMDMQMPVMDGLQATQAIRSRLHLTELPIIAMTANAMAADRDACLAAGMNDHVGKPFDLQQLVKVLLHWSGREHSPTLAAPPPPNDPPLAPVFDPDGATQRLGGDQRFFGKLLSQFLSEAPHMLHRVQTDWGRNAPAVAASSHTLKGSASTLGLMALAQAAAMAEQHAKTNATQDELTWPAELLTQLQTALEHAVQDGQAWLALHGLASTTPTSPEEIDIQPLLPDLNELAHMLSQSDMAALDLYDQLVQDHALDRRASWAPLNHAMNDLDFEAALAALQGLLAPAPTTP